MASLYKTPFHSHLALSMFALTAITMGSAWSQPIGGIGQNPPRLAPPRKVGLQPGRSLTAFNEIISIDPTAKALTVQTYKLGQDDTSIAPNNGYAIKLVPNKIEVMPLTSDALIVRYQKSLQAPDLKVGDLVTWLGRKVTYSTASAVPNARAISGYARRENRAEFVRAVSLNPLVLRAGGDPVDNATVINLPLINEDKEELIGTMSVSPTNTRRTVPVAGPHGEMNIPAPLGDASITFNISHVEGLEFDKFTPLTLAEAAADFAAKKVMIHPEYETNAEGKTQIKRVTVVSGP